MKAILALLLALVISNLPGFFHADAQAAEDSAIFNRARFFPAAGHEQDMMGGKLLGSNASPKEGFELLGQIKGVPAAGQWTELTFTNTRIYRWIEYQAPPGSYGRVAKLEFYSGEHKLDGESFGSFPVNGGRKTQDGKPPSANIMYQGDKPDGQCIGLDLGDAATSPKPELDPASGEFKSPVTVTLTAKTPGAVIRYTTDGTRPTSATGKVYSGPITIDKTTTICAAAFENGKPPTRTVDGTYIIGNAIHCGGFHVGNSLTDVTSSCARQACTAGFTSDTRYFLMGSALTKAIWNTALEMVQLGVFPAEKIHWINQYANQYAEQYGKTALPDQPAGAEATRDIWKKLWPSVTQIDDFTLQPRDFNIAEEADYDNRFLNMVLQEAPNAQPWLYIEWVERERHRPTDLGKEPTSEMKTVWPAMTWEESMAAMVLYGEDLERKVNETYKGTKPIRILPTALAMGWIHHMIANGEVPGVARDEFYPELFNDPVHTNAEGSFLVDCTWYAAFHGESPEGKFLPILTKLTHDQAQIMQRLAWDVVKNYPDCGYYKTGTMPTGQPAIHAASRVKDVTPVTLMSSTPGAWFRYTLDGTPPSRANGYIYCGVISMCPGMTLKAIAYKSGMADSAVVTYPGDPTKTSPHL